MTIPHEVVRLVERFAEQRDLYLRGAYHEAHLRQDFLDPFFEALGWDVSNRQGAAEPYREVIHEDRVQVGGLTKAPDYSFRVGGTRKFFVEAKKPSVDIKSDPAPALQLRRYSWSAKLPLGLLTDFDEFAVYDCRVRPHAGDKASVARIAYIRFDELQERWNELSDVFSRDAVIRGSFDHYATRKKAKGTLAVDEAFLEEIETWRDALARNLALRNGDLTQAELNYAVQQTIDRVVFLRICEDRGIEPAGQLLGLTNGEHAYERLCDVFRKADERYNSGLFHFRAEKDIREAPDELSLRLGIDDSVVRTILRSLYPPESPYEFSVITSDILGQVYERFLGQVIRLTEGHRAKVEEKPEVRKAGGVYYTPSYVVTVMVERTVGPLLKDADPKRAASIRVVDPACGSGSFLLVAYQYLLDWHLRWYVEHGPEKYAKGKSPQIYGAVGRGWNLTTQERKRILVNNIYGVDIDSQAVEVTKLSLLLKVLEGEDEQSLNKSFSLFRERVLPDLHDNIRCGNSLVSFDDIGQLDLDGDEAIAKLNPFDWRVSYKGIFEQGGFDAVIGNPPYISAMAITQLYGSDLKEYWKKRFATAAGAYDIYVLFIEQALMLTKKGGLVAFITPNKYLSAPYAQTLRTLLTEQHSLELLIDYSNVSVFEDASVYPVVSVIRANSTQTKAVSVVRASEGGQLGPVELSSVEALELFPEKILGTLLGNHTQLCSRIYARSKLLQDVAEVRATSTAAEADEFSDYVSEDKHGTRGFKLVNTGTIDRFVFLHGYKELTNKRKKYQYPSLDMKRIKPDRASVYRSPKIVFSKMAKHIKGALDADGSFASLNTNCVYSPCEGISLLYLAGVLNSRLMSFTYRQVFSALRMSGGYLQYQAPQLRLLPIAMPSPQQREKVEQLVAKRVECGLSENSARTPHEKTAASRQAESLDAQLDRTVNEIYGMTEEDLRALQGEMPL